MIEYIQIVCEPVILRVMPESSHLRRQLNTSKHFTVCVSVIHGVMQNRHTWEDSQTVTSLYCLCTGELWSEEGVSTPVRPAEHLQTLNSVCAGDLHIDVESPDLGKQLSTLKLVIQE